MAVYKLSNEAEKDIAFMYERGIEDFGLAQAKRYILNLMAYVQLLSTNRSLGNAAIGLNPAHLRKFKYEAHIIFYVPADYGVFIVRVLSQRMAEQKHIKYD